MVQPLNSLSVPLEDTELSTERITVVPTAQIRLLSFKAVLMICVALLSIIISSLSILCLERSSTSTGLNVPNPTWSVSSAKFIPLISRRFNKCFEKCKPAVGAATAPSFLA